VTARRSSAVVLALAAVAVGLAACGRRNPPKPPNDRKAEYTYPRFYPAPATVLPDGADTTVRPVEEEPTQETQPRKLSPVPSPDSRTRTRTFGPSSR
jgi:predicted small lipoprotein YifL